MISLAKMTALGLLAGAATLSVGAAQAQSVNFQGSAAGCFGTGCTPGATATTQGLTYNGSTFNVTTVEGFVSIGSQVASPNINNLGSFTLTSAPGSYTGQVFNLAVTFTSPSGTSPSVGNFSAILRGLVEATANGGVQFTFATPAQNFTFPGGAFTLSVNNTSVTAGASAPLTGQIVATPGPVAGAGLAALLCLLGVGIHLGRKNSNA